MTYKAQCEKCGDQVDDPFLMAQFHEDEFMTRAEGDYLREADFELTDTITFCAGCTLKLLLDDAP